MKLYMKPGACSLSPHIVLRELGLPFEVENVDLAAKTVGDGSSFLDVNPKGQVPTLALDDGQILTEGAVIVQYLADRAPEAGLLPAAGTMERYRVQEWLNFVASELHKSFSPLFNPATPDAFKEIAKNNLARKFANLDRHLATSDYLGGRDFTVADAYAFTILRWAAGQKIDLDAYENVAAYMKRIAARPKVQETLKAEGLA